MIEPGTQETGTQETTPSWFRMKAVLVHLYTASGAVLALLMLVAAFQGEAVQALWLMFLSLLVDSTDGLLARRFRVSEALPFFDGALLRCIRGKPIHPTSQRGHSQNFAFKLSEKSWRHRRVASKETETLRFGALRPSYIGQIHCGNDTRTTFQTVS